LADVVGEIRTVLAAPLDFPPLEQAVIPGDRVLLVLDRDTPMAAEIIGEIWAMLSHRDVDPADVTILQPAALCSGSQSDPRAVLPENIKNLVEWKIHDPTESEVCGYLAATASGERVYLARDVTEADVVLSIGEVAFDSLLGFRGTHSAFYPGLSNTEALGLAHGQGHRELGPDDDRPLRQMIDDVGWMLGTQFSIQVVASVGNGAAKILAGAIDSVFARAKQLLTEFWLVELDSRPKIVIAAIDCDAAGHDWRQVGAALESARNLVDNGGKIVILSELSAETGPGMQLLRESETPGDAIQPLRTFLPPDLTPATQLAAAADWADVYLLSKLDGDVVEELFMTPLANGKEAARLLGGAETCLFLPSAQHTFGRVRQA
jgi:nickel-dependent lactate racemase